jgi:uncharacterized protein YbjT (DUF2867 family)
MILIIGASGAVGIPLIKQLVARGIPLKALTSSEASEKNLKSLGVEETVLGDFTIDADVRKAMKGAASACYIPSRFREDEFEIGKRVVDAAIAEELEHLLVCSAYHPQMRALGHHWKKLELEEYLVDSDLMYSVVQPSMFMQNVRVEWQTVVNDGLYPRPYSIDSRMNVIDTDDLGQAMANILTDQRFWGATYELCGAGTISHREMAVIISDELGSTVTAVERDIEEWKKWATERGWADYSIKTYVNMCTHYDRHGYKYGNDVTLHALIGRPATDYRSFIQKFIKRQAA